MKSSLYVLMFCVMVVCSNCASADNAVKPVDSDPVCTSADNATLTLADNQTLVMYYSKMGTTRIVADEVSRRIPEADIVEIQSDVGIMKAVFWHQLFNRNAAIKPLDIDLSPYTRIILCSPIWLQKISSPARTVINTMPMQGKEMHLLITCGGKFIDGSQEKLKKHVSTRGIEYRSLGVVKTGGKSEEEIRKQTCIQLKSVFATQNTL